MAGVGPPQRLLRLGDFGFPGDRRFPVDRSPAKIGDGNWKWQNPVGLQVYYGHCGNSVTERTSAWLVGKLIDGNGWMIGCWQQSQTDIPVQTDWPFAIPVGGVHTELATEPAEHSVIVYD